MVTPVAENALLLMVSVSGEVPAALEYLSVMVQEPPGATAAEQPLLVMEKALPAPCPKTSELIFRFKLPVFVTVVVSDELKLGNFIAPVFTISLFTVPFRSADVDVAGTIQGYARRVDKSGQRYLHGGVAAPSAWPAP